MLLKDQKPFPALFADDAIRHAVRNPTTTRPGAALAEAIRLMESHEIWDLPVVEEDGRLVGLLHLHPAIKALLGISS
jgi:arabinose-5-phosphate isomerase